MFLKAVISLDKSARVSESHALPESGVIDTFGTGVEKQPIGNLKLEHIQ
jgi:hypothetical protein